jgi:hypothetical protein
MLVAMSSLVVLTIVDFTSISIFFISISVDILTTIQFIALGLVAVLFKVRARARHQNVAWFFWAMLTFFGGFMFMMNTVIIQGDDTKPEYVTRAESNYQGAKDKLDDLLFQQSDYRSKNQRSLAMSMEASIEKARETMNEASKEATQAEERHRIEPGKKIRAIEIFARIPYIFKNPTPELFIAASFFIVLFSSVELSIFSIAGEIGTPMEKKTRMTTMVKIPWAKSAYKEILDDRFEDVTDDEYRRSAEYKDGSVRLPEEVAHILKIGRDEAEMIHSRLYAGYIYRDDRYVKIGNLS